MRNLSEIQRMIKIENKSCKITIQKKYETRTYTKYTTMYNSRGVENPYVDPLFCLPRTCRLQQFPGGPLLLA